MVDDFLPTLPNAQQNLLNRQSWFGDSLCWPTFLRPQPFLFEVAVSYALYISTNRPLQEWVDNVTIQQHSQMENQSIVTLYNSIYQACLCTQLFPSGARSSCWANKVVPI